MVFCDQKSISYRKNAQNFFLRRKPTALAVGKPNHKLCYNSYGSDITPAGAKSFS